MRVNTQNAFGKPASVRMLLAVWTFTVFLGTLKRLFVIGLYQIS